MTTRQVFQFSKCKFWVQVLHIPYYSKDQLAIGNNFVQFNLGVSNSNDLKLNKLFQKFET